MQNTQEKIVSELSCQNKTGEHTVSESVGKLCHTSLFFLDHIDHQLSHGRVVGVENVGVETSPERLGGKEPWVCIS